jgi:hypothetical protein
MRGRLIGFKQMGSLNRGALALGLQLSAIVLRQNAAALACRCCMGLMKRTHATKPKPGDQSPPKRRAAQPSSPRRRSKRIPASAAESDPLAEAETAALPRASDPAASEAAAPASVEHDRGSYDADTAIKLYLREIGQVKLLTPQEEIELAARIKRGDKKAREHMIKANLRLVVKIARDYEGLGLPLLDLISEGNIGLMKAVERFDPTKGGKLSTYGSWWIKQSIKRALANQSKTIRLPVHLVDKISRMRRVALKLQEVLGREPTDEELAEELGMTSARVAQMRLAAIPRTLTSSSKTRRSPACCWSWSSASTNGSPRFCGFGLASTAVRKRPWKKWARSSASRANASGKSRTSPSRNCAA